MVKVDKETMIPIGVASFVAVTMFGGLLWLNNTLADMKARQQQDADHVTLKLDALQDAVAALREQVGHSPTKAEINAWVKLLFAKNSSLAVVEFDK